MPRTPARGGLVPALSTLPPVRDPAQSLLDGADRVWSLATDESVPLLGRVRLCAIVSAGLDELFAVHGATLSVDVSRHARDLAARQGRLWCDTLVPELAAAGVRLRTAADCDEAGILELARYFEDAIFPSLTPLAVGPGLPTLRVPPLSLVFAVIASRPGAAEDRLACVILPDWLPRFVAVGSEGLRLPLEEAIGPFLPSLFPGTDLVEQALFRVTREAGQSAGRSDRGWPVRLEISVSASGALVERLQRELGVDETQTYRTHGVLDLSGLADLGLEPAAYRSEPPARRGSASRRAREAGGRA